LKTRRPNDLDRAIDAGRATLALTPRASPDRVIYLSNLASWLDDRHSRSADPADLDESIAVLEDAFGAVADLSTNRARVAFTLAGRYERRYSDREPPDLADLQQACDLWDETLAAGEPFIAVYAGQHLGDVALAIGDWAKCEKALALSLDAARTLTASRHLNTDRERARLGVQGTAAMAALAASRDGRRDEAVTYLEQGTATLLAEASGLASETITVERARRATTILPGQLVYWAAIPAGSLALIASPDDDAIVTIPLPVTTAEVDVQLAKLRASFDAGSDAAHLDGADQLQAWSRSVHELLAWTWNAFVEPVEQHIAGDGRVGLVPIGRLAWLPLATARVPGRLALAQRCVPHMLPGAHFLRIAAQWPTQPAAYVAADLAHPAATYPVSFPKRPGSPRCTGRRSRSIAGGGNRTVTRPPRRARCVATIDRRLGLLVRAPRAIRPSARCSTRLARPTSSTWPATSISTPTTPCRRSCTWERAIVWPTSSINAWAGAPTSY
jgi:hypothetical protein